MGQAQGNSVTLYGGSSYLKYQLQLKIKKMLGDYHENNNSKQL